MRIRRSSRQSEQPNNRKAHNTKSTSSEQSTALQVPSADSGVAQSPAMQDQFVTDQDQSTNQSSKLDEKDRYSLAERQHQEAKASATGNKQQQILSTEPTFQTPTTRLPKANAAITLPASANTLVAMQQPDMRSMQSASQHGRYPPPDSQLWVRIPFPLAPFIPTLPGTSQPGDQIQTTGNDPDNTTTNSDSPATFSYQYIARPGWFNLSATYMREMTVTSLDKASNALWEGSRAKKVQQPDDLI